MVQRYPNPEEWRAIQGGQPIILQSPSGKIFELVHAYKTLEGEYAGPLAVVPTPREQLLGTEILHLALRDTDDDIVAPAALLWERHGQPCEERSRDSYDHLKPHKVDSYVEKRQSEGWKLVEPKPIKK